MSAFDRWRWMRRRVRRGARTLDAGSGSGWFALYLAHLGNETVGVSFDEHNNLAARRRAQTLGITNATFREGDLRELDHFGPALGEFDQITCFETIEHIRNDRKLIADLGARLTRGGQILLTTPYLHHRPVLDETVSTTEDGGHVRWGTTHEDLREMFSAAGLQTVAEDYISGVVVQKLYNLTRRLSRVLGHRGATLAVFPLRLLQLVDRPVTQLTGYPYLCVAVAAVKPR